MDRYEHCQVIVAKCHKTHMAHPATVAALDAEDWSQLWPEVDRYGRLTAQILDSDGPPFIPVDWDGRKLVPGCQAGITVSRAPQRLIRAAIDGGYLDDPQEAD